MRTSVVMGAMVVESMLVIDARCRAVVKVCCLWNKSGKLATWPVALSAKPRAPVESVSAHFEA